MQGKVISNKRTQMRDDVLTLNPDQKSMRELWRGHRSVHYEGYLGNEGATKDTTYHKLVLLAVPPGGANLDSYYQRYGLEGAYNMLQWADGKVPSDTFRSFLTMATDKGAGGSWSQSGSFRTRLLTDILAEDAAHVDELTVMLLKLYGRSHQEWREYNVWRQYGAAPNEASLQTRISTATPTAAPVAEGAQAAPTVTAPLTPRRTIPAVSTNAPATGEKRKPIEIRDDSPSPLKSRKIMPILIVE